MIKLRMESERVRREEIMQNTQVICSIVLLEQIRGAFRNGRNLILDVLSRVELREGLIFLSQE